MNRASRHRQQQQQQQQPIDFNSPEQVLHAHQLMLNELRQNVLGLYKVVEHLNKEIVQLKKSNSPNTEENHVEQK